LTKERSAAGALGVLGVRWGEYCKGQAVKRNEGVVPSQVLGREGGSRVLSYHLHRNRVPFLIPYVLLVTGFED